MTVLHSQKPGPVHFLHTCCRVQPQAHGDAKCKDRAAGQALTREIGVKAGAHPHSITPPEHLWNKYTWLILSKSIQCTKKCLEILKYDFSGASAL